MSRESRIWTCKPDRGVPVAPGVLTPDAADILEDPEIDIVVELIGGLDKAREFILEAMEKGKHVVTANKALLAEYGPRSMPPRPAAGSAWASRRSVCGGIPVVGAVKRGLSANRITTMMGILNGTSNYILTRMTRRGPALRPRRSKRRCGWASPKTRPPWTWKGTDAAHKLAILISLAFGAPVALRPASTRRASPPSPPRTSSSPASSATA